MKKIMFYIFIVSFLLGCGGGGSDDAVENDTPLLEAERDDIVVENDIPSLEVEVPINAFDAPTIEASIKQAYLKAVNDARSINQVCGARGNMPATTPLVWNDALYRAAYSHSEDMAESNTFSHTGSGTASDWTAQILSLGRGSTFQERIETNGYTKYSTIGENLTAGTIIDTVQKAVVRWLDSDSHCVSLMNPNFKDMGMAHVENSTTRYTHYWTHNFGAKL